MTTSIFITCTKTANYQRLASLGITVAMSSQYAAAQKIMLDLPPLGTPHNKKERPKWQFIWKMKGLTYNKAAHVHRKIVEEIRKN